MWHCGEGHNMWHCGMDARRFRFPQGFARLHLWQRESSVCSSPGGMRLAHVLQS